MKVLVINLTRMGDLIQTIGLINNIHNHIPDPQIDVLVMKSFSPIVSHFNYINQIIPIDEEIFGNNIPEDIWGAFTELDKLINILNQNKYDLLFNPIISKQSSLLTYLINAPQKFGLQLTENREQKMTCDYISYLLANQHSLGDFSFNLVDIFAGMVKSYLKVVTHQNCDSLKESCSEFILSPQRCDPTKDFSLNIFPEDIDSISDFTKQVKRLNKPIIGFHIGASQSNKAWEIEYYHKVIEILLAKKDYVLILFGGYKEKDYKGHFIDFTTDLFFNTIGDFSLSKLIAAINIIDIFVTNDTGPMHIASALHKPVIDISLGPVSKWETGAYNQDALIIEARLDCHPCSFINDCSHWNCHHYITPEIIVNAIEYKIKSDKNTPLIPSPKVKFFTSQIDDFGFLSFIPYFSEEISEKEYIFLLKRFIWSLYFTNQLYLDENSLHLLREKTKSNYLFQNIDFTNIHNHISELLKIAKNILIDLNSIISNPKNADLQKQILLSIKKSKDTLFNKAKEYELIYDWFWFFLFKESEIDDFEIDTIVKKTISLYEILIKKLSIFQKFL